MNKNSVIVDNRIGESSSKLSEEDKMKLRYMREARDRARELLQQKDDEMEDRKHAGTATQLNVKSSRKRTKYQLAESDSDGDDVFTGFTHGGKKLGDDDARDDYNEYIAEDSDDDKHDRSKRKGFLTDDMVAQMNFGGFEGEGGQPAAEGAEPAVKKTRKEVFEEIMEKSKNYDAARKELKQINLDRKSVV